MNLHINVTQKAFLYFVIIPYLKPYNVILNTTLDNIYKIWKILVTILVLILFITKKHKLSKQSLFAFAFVGVWTLSIYLNCKTLENNIQEILSIIGIIIFIELIKDSQNKINELFKVLYNISVVYFVLQLITIIMHKPLFGTPVNEYDIYFLGGDNHSAFLLLPLCSFLFAHDFRFYKTVRIKTYVYAFIGWFGLIYTFSVTGMFAYGIYIILILFLNYPIMQKIITPKSITTFTVFFLLGVIFFNIQDIYMTLASYFGKVGLSSREIIWKDAFNVFCNNWLIGIGSLTKEQVSNYILYGAAHAHNIVLEILMDTGIIGSTLFYVWINKILNINKKNTSSNQTKSLVNCFIAYLFCGIFDFYLGLIYFYLLMMIIYISKLEDERQNKSINYK